jgi:hypothetical protein
MSLPSCRVVVVVILLALAGCAGPPGPPWPEIASPGGITLRWYPDEVSEAEAQQVAAAHCAVADRNARMAALERDGSAEIARYRCL